MLSSKASISIGIVILILFSGVAYETIEHSSSSTTVSVSPGFLNVTPELSPSINFTNPATNVTYPLFYLLPTTQYIYLNFSMKSSSSTVYLYDISPLNNTTSVWLNLTSFNQTEYPHNFVTISNASSTLKSYSHKLYINKTAYEKMNPTISMYHPEIYHALIILISSNGNSTGFPILFIKPYVKI